jgi:hypothetical protein
MKAGRVTVTQQTECFLHPRSRFLQYVANALYVDGRTDATLAFRLITAANLRVCEHSRIPISSRN